MRVGVLGCGYWGAKHVRVLHSIDEVTSVVLIDGDEARTRQLHQTFPSTAVYRSLDEAIAAGAIDAVVIASPPASHAALALRAIECGVHTLVEKPMTTSTLDAHRLIWAAAEHNVTLMAGHTFEYNAAVWRLRDAVRNDELGKIHYLDAARLNLGLYQSDVNVIWDLAPHDVSVANFVLGDVPSSVTAWASRCAAAKFQDVALLRLEYASGVMATIRVSWLDPCKVRRTTVVGSQKMAVYNDLNDNERVKLYDRGINAGPPAVSESVHEAPTSYRYGDVVAPYVDFKEPLFVEDRHFVQSIINGTQPNTSGADGMAVVQVLEMADRSLLEHRTVYADEYVFDDFAPLALLA